MPSLSQSSITIPPTTMQAAISAARNKLSAERVSLAIHLGTDTPAMAELAEVLEVLEALELRERRDNIRQKRRFILYLVIVCAVTCGRIRYASATARRELGCACQWIPVFR